MQSFLLWNRSFVSWTTRIKNVVGTMHFATRHYLTDESSFHLYRVIFTGPNWCSFGSLNSYFMSFDLLYEYDGSADKLNTFESPLSILSVEWDSHSINSRKCMKESAGCYQINWKKSHFYWFELKAFRFTFCSRFTTSVFIQQQSVWGEQSVNLSNYTP